MANQVFFCSTKLLADALAALAAKAYPDLTFDTLDVSQPQQYVEVFKAPTIKNYRATTPYYLAPDKDRWAIVVTSPILNPATLQDVTFFCSRKIGDLINQYHAQGL